jgi:hypothetical protein
MKKPETPDADKKVEGWAFVVGGNFFIASQILAGEVKADLVTHEATSAAGRGIGVTAATLGVVALGQLLSHRRERDELRSTILRLEEETTKGINMFEPARYQRPKLFTDEWFFDGPAPSTTHDIDSNAAINKHQMQLEIEESSEQQKIVWVNEKFSLVSAKLASVLAH